MQIISIILFSSGAHCPGELFMPYKKIKVSLTSSSSVQGIVDLQPQITNACTPACVPSLWIIFFPRNYFWILVLTLKVCKRDQNLSLKTNPTSRKDFHVSLSHHWREIGQGSWLFRKFAGSLGGPWGTLTEFHSEWLHSAHLKVSCCSDCV